MTPTDPRLRPSIHHPGSGPGWRLRACLAVACAAMMLALAVPARAQEADAPDDLDEPEAPPPPAQVNQPGEYSGVKPGDSPYKGPARKNILSWIGFQSSEGAGSRLFIQLSNEVPYSQKLEGKTLVVRLDGVRYRNRNVSRRLDMRFFDTSLRELKSKRVSRRRATKTRPAQAAGIELRITFKDPSDAQLAEASMRQEKDGYTYLYLDFKGGQGSGGISVSEPE